MKTYLRCYIFAFSIILTIVIFSCKKKDLPQPESGNEPVFYFTGTVNGVATSIQAGVNDYYMYSSYEQQDSSSALYKFIGDLKTVNCVSCTNSLKVIINDRRLSIFNSQSGADSAFLYNYYPYQYYSPASIKNTVQFNVVASGAISQVNWDFGDGTFSNVLNPSHVFTGMRTQNVSLTVTDTAGSSNTISNTYNLTSNNICKINNITSYVTNNAITYTTNVTGANPISYLWNLGDGTTSTAAFTTHTYSAPGRYDVSLRIIDANNDTAKCNYQAKTQSYNALTTNFFVTNTTPVANSYALSNIIIKWTDASGNIYSSQNVTQSSSSYFKIVSVEDYHTNEAGQNTKKLHIVFRCLVSNGTSSILINNGDAVIAVAYK